MSSPFRSALDVLALPGLRQIAAAGDLHDVTLELEPELLGHSDILPAGPGPTDGVSTSPAAVPISHAMDRGGRDLHRHRRDRVGRDPQTLF